jgi:hypothetical protein
MEYLRRKCPERGYAEHKEVKEFGKSTSTYGWLYIDLRIST